MKVRTVYFSTSIFCSLFQVTKQHNEDCKKLLRLMGVPVIEVTFNDLK